jgi:hypothetical protein
MRQRYRRFCYECEIIISAAKAAVRFCDVYVAAKTTTSKIIAPRAVVKLTCATDGALKCAATTANSTIRLRLGARGRNEFPVAGTTVAALMLRRKVGRRRNRLRLEPRGVWRRLGLSGNDFVAAGDVRGKGNSPDAGRSRSLRVRGRWRADRRLERLRRRARREHRLRRSTHAREFGGGRVVHSSSGGARGQPRRELAGARLG